MNEGPHILDRATTVGCPVCHAMPGDQCRAADGRTAGVMIHRARVTVWRASYASRADELDEHQAAQQAAAPETAQRLDDLEQQMGELIERLDRYGEAAINATHILGGTIALLPDNAAKRLGDLERHVGELIGAVQRVNAELDRHRGRPLPEDVPQNVRAGEDVPGVTRQWAAGDVIPAWGDRPLSAAEAAEANARQVTR